MLIPKLRIQVMVALIAAILAAANLAIAQTEATSTKADQQALSLTIYNSDIALVRDVRRLRLPAVASFGAGLPIRFAEPAEALAEVRGETSHADSANDGKQLHQRGFNEGHAAL